MLPKSSNPHVSQSYSLTPTHTHTDSLSLSLYNDAEEQSSLRPSRWEYVIAK